MTTTPPTASLPSLSRTPRRNSGPSCTLATLPTVTGVPLWRRARCPQCLAAADQADAAHCHLLVARLHHLRADVVVAALDGGDDLAQRDVVGAELDGIEIDLVLLHEAADARDFGDSGHGVELVLDEPVLHGVKRAAVVGTFDRVPEDLAYAGRIRPHHRYDARRQEAAGQAQPLQHAGAREVDVHRVFEDHVHHREAEGRGRAHVALGRPCRLTVSG